MRVRSLPSRRRPRSSCGGVADTSKPGRRPVAVVELLPGGWLEHDARARTLPGAHVDRLAAGCGTRARRPAAPRSGSRTRVSRCAADSTTTRRRRRRPRHPTARASPVASVVTCGSAGRSGGPRRCTCRSTATLPSGRTQTPSGMLQHRDLGGAVDVAEVEEPVARPRSSPCRRARAQGRGLGVDEPEPFAVVAGRPRGRTAARTTPRRPARHAAPRWSCRRAPATVCATGSNHHS